MRTIRIVKKAFTLIEVLVVVAVIVVLGTLIYALMSGAKKEAKDTNSLSNLRQLGIAASMYSEDFGAWPTSCKFLVDAGLVPKELVASTNDVTDKGLGNMAILSEYAGMPAPKMTPYKLTYGGFLEWHISEKYQQIFKEDEGGGWLVDLSPGKPGKTPDTMLFAEGAYHRLLFDSSVTTRQHRSANLANGSARSALMLFGDDVERYLE